MNGFTIIVGILVVLIILTVIATYLLQRYNTYANQNNILYPFYAAVKPGDTTAYLNNASGTSQIDCSAVGGKINIVGAWAEVIDPYGECSGSSAGVVNLSCGLATTNIACSVDADCGPGMNCAGGICKPSQCPANKAGGYDFTNSNCSCGGNYCPVRPGKPCSGQSDCNDTSGAIMTCNPSSGVCEVNPGQTCMAPDPFTQEVCAIYPLCSNLDTSKGFTDDPRKNPSAVVNKICAFDNPGTRCRPRDASAYLAGVCDGKDTCTVIFDPTNPLSGFGPSPCEPGSATDISRLPNIPGSGGNYGQGYYVHGLYTCIVPQ